MVLDYEVGMDAAGKLTALKGTMYGEMGGYVDLIGGGLFLFMMALDNCYNIPAFNLQVQCCHPLDNGCTCCARGSMAVSAFSALSHLYEVPMS